MSDPGPEPSGELPTHHHVRKAAQRLAGRILQTPVVQRASLNDELGCEVHFKCENLQRTGSFKFRGATNAVACLVNDESLVAGDGHAGRDAGVATHSSGNHGAALALAARQAGLMAHVVVPAGASPAKREAIVRYGGRIIDCGETLAEREAALEAVCRETGASFIPPYDHPDVIAGQGTAALELTASVPGLEEIWVPVGGGGMASGSLLAVDGGIRVRGGEPELADDAFLSLRKGERQPQKPPLTVADGLRTALGELPFRLFRQHGLDIVRVSEAAILSAQRLVWQRLKLVVEPSAVVGLAALLETIGQDPAGYRGRRVGVILTGGNVGFPAA